MMHATDPVAWERLSRVLDDLGKETGLFDHLGIKRLGGKQLSRPFQLAISIAGQMGDRTLVDVGYGVSQALPVAVEALDRPQGATLLLQQPEVHLHPRAQAGLGAFFARVARDRGIRFVVETHSDYLVDRVRMAIRDGVLERRDVALLWFRSSQGVSRVDRIDLADDGSIREAPEGYREFFLREKLSILGGA
jgi:predicted ATPase